MDRYGHILINLYTNLSGVRQSYNQIIISDEVDTNITQIPLMSTLTSITTSNGSYDDPNFIYTTNTGQQVKLNYGPYIMPPEPTPIRLQIRYTFYNFTGSNITINGSGITPNTYGGSIFFVDIPANTSPCLHPDSLVSISNGGDISNIRIEELRTHPDVKLIDYHGKEIDLLFNAKCSITEEFVLIKEDAFGHQTPNKDLLITKHHPIWIDGKEILPADKIDNDKVKIVQREARVYTLGTEERTYVMINNIPVCTWAEKEFDEIFTKLDIPHQKL